MQNQRSWQLEWSWKFALVWETEKISKYKDLHLKYFRYATNCSKVKSNNLVNKFNILFIYKYVHF